MSSPQYFSREELAPYLIHDDEGWHYDLYGDQYSLTQKFMKWNKRIIPVGNGYGDEVLWEIQYRRNQGKSNIFIVTGEAGEGKSWWSIAFGQFFDPKFKIRDIPAPPPDEDDSQITFDRRHILHLLGNDSPLKPGQVVVIDEAQFSQSARRWYDDLQKDLMEVLESIRSRGYMLLIVALHKSLLDRIVRNYVPNYHVHVWMRGQANIYKIKTHQFYDKTYLPKVGKLQLPMPDEGSCGDHRCLTCNFCWGTNQRSRRNHNPEMRKCMNLRATYERRKREYTGKRTAETKKRVEEQMIEKEFISNKAAMEYLYENQGKLVFNQAGYPDKAAVSLILEDGFPSHHFGKNRLDTIRKMLIIEHPELKEELE